MPPPHGIADYGIAELDFHRIEGGLLVETKDALELDHSQLNVVTRRRCAAQEFPRYACAARSCLTPWPGDSKSGISRPRY